MFIQAKKELDSLIKSIFLGSGANWTLIGNQLPVNQRVQGNHQTADEHQKLAQKFVCGCHWLVTMNKEVVVVRCLLF